MLSQATKPKVATQSYSYHPLLCIALVTIWYFKLFTYLKIYYIIYLGIYLEIYLYCKLQEIRDLVWFIYYSIPST